MNMIQCLVFVAVASLTVTVQPAYCYRILGVFPTPSFSHQVVFRGLTLALNKRGHELVVVTPDPIRDPTLVNYTEIDTRITYDAIKGHVTIEGRSEKTWVDWLAKNMNTVIIRTVFEILDHPDMRKLYAPNSGEKFDLLIIEFLFWESLMPLATRFNVPTIGITSMGLSINGQLAIGNPIDSNQLSNWELGPWLAEGMSFWQRLANFFKIWQLVYWYRTNHMIRQEAIAKKYFGNYIPDLDDLCKNVSLIFVNQQGPISYARPNIPKVIEIGEIHDTKESTDMPEKLKKILDEATAGFVYMSLGTNVKSNELTTKTRDTFISAFSRLPYQVLWKFEDDVLPNKPNNVHIMKWIPQQAVLAHPNVKVFVYQGGLQSTEEAVSHAVPLIGFPVFADQDMQVIKMVSLGVARKLEIEAFDETELFEAIGTVATDTSYKQRMLNLRSLINDKPHDPLDTAVWWTEHVIRHRGAPHLHSSTADEPWYARQDMDIVAFISAGFVISASLVLVVSYKLVRIIYTFHTAMSPDTKKLN